LDEGEIRFPIKKQVKLILESAVKLGIFASKNDVARIALIKYLDEMNLLDKLKNDINSQPIDE